MNIDDSQKKINLAILIAFVCFVANYAMVAIYKDLNANGLSVSVYTDWFINYSAGFLRRGLAGEFIMLMSNIITPYKMAVLISWGIFFSLCLSFFYLIAKNIRTIPPFYLLVLLFLPSSILFYIFDHQALGRKETLGFLFVFVHLIILQRHIAQEKNVSSYIKNSAILTFVLLPVHIFIHEASLFLFVPLHLMISWAVFSSQDDNNHVKKAVIISLCYSPVFISFLAVYFLGSTEFSLIKEMCLNLEYREALQSGFCTRATNTLYTMPGAMGALSWSFEQAISLSASLSKEVIFMWLVLYSLLAFITMSYLSNLSTILSRKQEENKPEKSNTEDGEYGAMIRFKYFIFPLICTMPLYIVGWDFGRWIAVVCINFSMIALSSELGLIELRSYSRQGLVLRKLAKIAKPIQLSKKSLSSFVAITLVVICFFYVRVPTCCIKEDNFSFLAQPLKSFAQLLFK